MANINITSDLTIANTKLQLDGNDITSKEKVIGISFYASSPLKDEEGTGWIDCSITTVDENGTVENKSYRKSEYMIKKLPMGQNIKDMIEKHGVKDIIRFIGSDIEQEKKLISDKIMDYCKDKNIKCPDTDVLYNRTIGSLKDKAIDLGINLEG